MNRSVLISVVFLFVCGNIIGVNKYEQHIKEEAEHLYEEGWIPLPEMPTIEEQLELLNKVESKFNENGFQEYIILCGENISPSPTLELAQKGASEWICYISTYWESNLYTTYSDTVKSIYTIRLKGNPIPVTAWYKIENAGITVQLKYALEYDYTLLAQEEVIPESRSEVEYIRRIDRVAKKEAKRLKKEGWVVTHGALSLDKQLEHSYLMELEYEYDENLVPKYIMASAQCIGENYNTAKIAANSLAICNLANQIAYEAYTSNESAMAQQHAGTADLTTSGQTIPQIPDQTQIYRINQLIGRPVNMLECYRELDNGSFEVIVRIACDSEVVKQIVQEEIKKDAK